MTASPVVDLPLPDSPTIASVSPRWRLNEMSLTAVTVGPRVANLTQRFFTSSRGCSDALIGLNSPKDRSQARAWQSPNLARGSGPDLLQEHRNQSGPCC